ncbi:MAG: tetratricopeptide repeat protein, partial [Terriglobia bacterium]
LRLDKTSVDAGLLLSQVQSAMGDKAAAAATLAQTIQSNPRNIMPYFQLALLDDQTGDWQKAQGLYQKVLQIQPDFPQAQNNLAYLMVEHDQNLDVALSLAQSALREMPNSPAAADTLGSAYFHRGEYRLAEGMFKQALAKSPSNAEFHYHLGLTYEKLGDGAQAKLELNRVLALDPTFKDADKVRQALAEVNKG